MAITPEDYFEAVSQRGALGTQMRVFKERYDLLLTPTLPIAAFNVGKLAPVDDGKGKWVYWTPFSYPFNLTQQPAVSVPCGFTKAGLPVGLHIVGKMFDDRTVLRASQAYEGAMEWGGKEAEDNVSLRSVVNITTIVGTLIWTISTKPQDSSLGHLSF